MASVLRHVSTTNLRFVPEKFVEVFLNFVDLTCEAMDQN